MISDAIGMTLLGGGFALAAAIFRFVPQRMPANGKFVSDEVCRERHKNIDRSLSAIEKRQAEMQRDITDIKLAIVPVTHKQKEPRP